MVLARALLCKPGIFLSHHFTLQFAQHGGLGRAIYFELPAWLIRLLCQMFPKSIAFPGSSNMCMCLFYLLILYEPGHFMVSISWKHSKIKLICIFAFLEVWRWIQISLESLSLPLIYGFIYSYYSHSIFKNPIIHNIVNVLYNCFYSIEFSNQIKVL